MISEKNRFTIIATETLEGSGAIQYTKARQWFETFEEAEQEAKETIAKNKGKYFDLVIVCAYGVVSPLQVVPTTTKIFNTVIDKQVKRRDFGVRAKRRK